MSLGGKRARSGEQEHLGAFGGARTKGWLGSVEQRVLGAALPATPLHPPWVFPVPPLATAHLPCQLPQRPSQGSQPAVAEGDAWRVQNQGRGSGGREAWAKVKEEGRGTKSPVKSHPRTSLSHGQYTSSAQSRNPHEDPALTCAQGRQLRRRLLGRRRQRRQVARGVRGGGDEQRRRVLRRVRGSCGRARGAAGPGGGRGGGGAALWAERREVGSGGEAVRGAGGAVRGAGVSGSQLRDLVHQRHHLSDRVRRGTEGGHGAARFKARRGTSLARSAASHAPRPCTHTLTRRHRHTGTHTHTAMHRHAHGHTHTQARTMALRCATRRCAVRPKRRSEASWPSDRQAARSSGS